MQTTPHEPRNTRLEARVSSVQKELFQRAATLTGRTLSDLIVESTQEAATRIVQEHEIIRLTREDQIAFVTALLDSTPPPESLIKAANQYKQSVTLEI